MTLRAVAISLVLGLQAPPAAPILIGPTAVHLTQADVEQIAQAVNVAGRPWLLEGQESHWFLGKWWVAAYSVPDQIAGRVRRGRFDYVTTAVPARDIYSGSHAWSRDATARYGQVAVAGADPMKLSGGRDPGRPFLLSGELSDDALVGIVDFVRSSPKAPPSARDAAPSRATIPGVHGSWPIAAVVVRADATVEVRLIDEGPSERSFQLVILSLVQGAWTVKSVSLWEAD